MDVQVNWLAIVLATLSTMVVGAIWYAPKVFGDTWAKLAKVDRGSMADAKMAMGVTLVVSFVTAFVLAHMVFLSHAFFKNSWMQDSLSTAFWVWLGFTATRIITHDAFENRRKKLTLLNISNELVTFLVMGLVLGLLQP